MLVEAIVARADMRDDQDWLVHALEKHVDSNFSRVTLCDSVWWQSKTTRMFVGLSQRIMYESIRRKSSTPQLCSVCFRSPV